MMHYFAFYRQGTLLKLALIISFELNEAERGFLCVNRAALRQHLLMSRAKA